MTHRWLVSPLLLGVVPALIVGGAGNALWAQDAPVDPESTPQGRTHYLGREIARTMHWRGATWLLRETREEQENGVLLREWMDVQPGQEVCDLGCGNGYHTLPLAAAVGEKGKVYAVDLQPQMLELLADRAREARLRNIEFVPATVDDPKLPQGSCDLILMVDVYHELSHPESVLRCVRAALGPEGRVVLVEFREEDPEVPIKPLHKMSKSQVVNELAINGFRLVDELDGLPWQHVLAFGRAADDAIEDRDGFAGRQVALGFVRDLADGDLRSLSGFYTEEVFALPGSELLKPEWGGGEQDRDSGARVARDEWLARYGRLLEVQGLGKWRTGLKLSLLEQDWLSIAPPTNGLWEEARPEDLVLTLRMVSDSPLSFVFRRDDVGRWRVVAERTDY